MTLVSETPEIRRRIIGVAEKIFLSSGFHRISMDVLARELGMSKKTLYAHFESKEALVKAVMEDRLATVELHIIPLLASPASFQEKLRELLRYLHSRMAEISPLFLEDIRRHAPDCFRIVEAFRSRAIPLYFGALLEEGAKAGLVRSDLPRELVIRMLLHSIQSIIRPEVMNELRMHPMAASDAILNILFQGILTPEGRSNHLEGDPS